MLLVQFSVKRIEPTSVELSWIVNNATELSDKYKSTISGFNLLYSESVNGPYLQVNKELIAELNFKHILMNYQHGRSFFYKLEAVFKDNKKELSGVLTIYRDQQKAIQSLTKVHLFQTMSGNSQITNTPVIFYQRRTSGEPCSRCKINKNMGNLSSKCQICDGTGYEGGYYNPILAWIDYKQPFNLSMSNNGILKDQTNSQIITTSAFFLVPRPGDYFREIFTPNRLYAIVSILQRSEDGNRPVSITFSCREEDSGHPLYIKDIPTELHFPPKIHYNRVFEIYDKINKEFREFYSI